MLDASDLSLNEEGFQLKDKHAIIDHQLSEAIDPIIVINKLDLLENKAP